MTFSTDWRKTKNIFMLKITYSETYEICTLTRFEGAHFFVGTGVRPLPGSLCCACSTCSRPRAELLPWGWPQTEKWRAPSIPTILLKQHLSIIITRNFSKKKTRAHLILFFWNVRHNETFKYENNVQCQIDHRNKAMWKKNDYGLKNTTQGQVVLNLMSTKRKAICDVNGMVGNAFRHP